MKLVHAQRLASLEGLLSQLGQAVPANKTTGAAPPRNQSASEPSRGAPRVIVRGDAVAEEVTGPVRTQPAAARATPPPQERVAPEVRPPVSVDTRPTPRVAATDVGGSAEDARLSSIKSTLFDQSKRFLSSCLDHLAAFRVEDGEVHFTFKHKDSFYADLLKGREQQEALRAVCAQVLGQPVRIYVTLEEIRAESQAPRLSARERADRDPGVEAFRKRFDGSLESVQDLSQE
jgi:hypothetical protein